MNESGHGLDYLNNELDYRRVPVRQRIYAVIPEWFREQFCPPNGFWSCAPLVLTYRAEVFVDATEPRQTVEATVFRTEYAAPYAVS